MDISLFGCFSVSQRCAISAEGGWTVRHSGGGQRQENQALEGTQGVQLFKRRRNNIQLTRGRTPAETYAKPLFSGWEQARLGSAQIRV